MDWWMVGLVQEEAAAGVGPQPIPSQKWTPVEGVSSRCCRKCRVGRTILRIGWAGLTDSKEVENGRSAPGWMFRLVWPRFLWRNRVSLFSILYFLYSSRLVLARISGGT